MAKVKCKYCNEFLPKQDASIIVEVNSKGIKKNIYIHNQCVNDYNELMEYKQNEINLFNEICEYIKELIGYTSQQKLPNNIFTRLRDIRNGTIMQKGIGRVVKSKEGYPYEVIYDTLLSNADKIRWSMSNKTFENETNKLNYLMAIVDYNINDTYIKFKNKEDFNNIKKRNNVIEEEKNIKDIPNTVINTSIKNTGISKFLNDDEF